MPFRAGGFHAMVARSDFCFSRHPRELPHRYALPLLELIAKRGPPNLDTIAFVVNQHLSKQGLANGAYVFLLIGSFLLLAPRSIEFENQGASATQITSVRGWYPILPRRHPPISFQQQWLR